MPHSYPVMEDILHFPETSRIRGGCIARPPPSPLVLRHTVRSVFVHALPMRGVSGPEEPPVRTIHLQNIPELAEHFIHSASLFTSFDGDAIFLTLGSIHSKTITLAVLHINSDAVDFINEESSLASAWIFPHVDTVDGGYIPLVVVEIGGDCHLRHLKRHHFVKSPSYQCSRTLSTTSHIFTVEEDDSVTCVDLSSDAEGRTIVVIGTRDGSVGVNISGGDDEEREVPSMLDPVRHAMEAEITHISLAPARIDDPQRTCIVASIHGEEEEVAHIQISVFRLSPHASPDSMFVLMDKHNISSEDDSPFSRISLRGLSASLYDGRALQAPPKDQLLISCLVTLGKEVSIYTLSLTTTTHGRRSKSEILLLHHSRDLEVVASTLLDIRLIPNTLECFLLTHQTVYNIVGPVQDVLEDGPKTPLTEFSWYTALMKHYPFAKAHAEKINATRAKRTDRSLIIDKALSVLGIPSAAYPPRNKEALATLLDRVYNAESLKMIARLSIIYYLARDAGTHTDFATALGLPLPYKHGMTAYWIFDHGLSENLREAVDLLVDPRVQVDWPDMIWSILIQEDPGLAVEFCESTPHISPLHRLLALLHAGHIGDAYLLQRQVASESRAGKEGEGTALLRALLEWCFSGKGGGMSPSERLSALIQLPCSAPEEAFILSYCRTSMEGGEESLAGDFEVMYLIQRNRYLEAILANERVQRLEKIISRPPHPSSTTRNEIVESLKASLPAVLTRSLQQMRVHEESEGVLVARLHRRIQAHEGNETDGMRTPSTQYLTPIVGRSPTGPSAPVTPHPRTPTGQTLEATLNLATPEAVGHLPHAEEAYDVAMGEKGSDGMSMDEEDGMILDEDGGSEEEADSSPPYTEDTVDELMQDAQAKVQEAEEVVEDMIMEEEIIEEVVEMSVRAAELEEERTTLMAEVEEEERVILSSEAEATSLEPPTKSAKGKKDDMAKEDEPAPASVPVSRGSATPPPYAISHNLRSVEAKEAEVHEEVAHEKVDETEGEAAPKTPPSYAVIHNLRGVEAKKDVEVEDEITEDTVVGVRTGSVEADPSLQTPRRSTRRSSQDARAHPEASNKPTEAAGEDGPSQTDADADVDSKDSTQQEEGGDAEETAAGTGTDTDMEKRVNTIGKKKAYRKKKPKRTYPVTLDRSTRPDHVGKIPSVPMSTSNSTANEETEGEDTRSLRRSSRRKGGQ